MTKAQEYRKSITVEYLKPALYSVLVLTVLIIGCNSTGEDGKKRSGEPARDERFAIYLLSDISMNAAMALRQDLDSLRISETPLITATEINSYYWNEHVVCLNSGLGYLSPPVEDVGVHGLPFVVTAKGKRMYLGAFWSNVSSVSFPAPVIDAVYSKFMSRPSSCYEIKRAYPADDFAQGPDPRGNPFIREVLEESGKIKLEGENPLNRRLIEVSE